MKRFELALQARLAMPKGYFAMPAKGVPLDGYGNVSRGFIAKVLSQLGTELLAGYQNTAKDAQAMARARKRNGTFFAMQPGNKQGLPPGIYQRIPGGLGHKTRAVFIFVRNTNYKVRLPFGKIVQDVYDREFRRLFAEALAANVADKQARLNGGS